MTSPIRYEFQLEDYNPKLAYPHLYVTKAPFDGGKGDDTLVGDDKSNLLRGGAGDDILIGKEGSDVLDGGNGADLVEFSIPYAWGLPKPIGKGIYANISKGMAKDLYGSKDKLVSIEHVWGTYLGDEIIGNYKSNDIAGGDGDDKLLGLGGDDLLYGGPGKDFLVGGAGKDTFFYFLKDEGGDRIEGFQSGVDKFLVKGSSFILPDRPAGYSIGELNAGRFFIGSSASSDKQLFGYDAATKNVLYDSNGATKGGVTVIATLTGSRSGLAASDIEIVV